MSSANLDILKCLCRLCAKQDKHCVNVFSSDGDKHLIRKKIRLCLPITIKENDVMPQQICLSCLNKLDTCYELYRGCVSAQSSIMKLIESSDVSITGISYPNPLLKVRKAVALDSSPKISESSPVSLKDFLKQDCIQPADTCSHSKSTVSDITPQKSVNDANNKTNAKNFDSGYPRIKVRKLDSDLGTGSEMISVDKCIEQRTPVGTELVNNDLDTQTMNVNQVSTCDPATTMNVSIIANTIPTDSSAAQLHLVPKVTNLQSLAEPSVSGVMTSSPTTTITSDCSGFEVATQPLNNIQPPQNVYLTSLSNNMSNPCSQMMTTPISSTYIASQTLVSSPLITSTYMTAPPDNTHQVTQAITPSYLIQPINSETTSNALVYVNTLNTGTSFLPHNTSQQINFTVSSAASDNNNILLTQDVPGKQTSTQESNISAHFNKVTTNTIADDILTSATSNIFVTKSPVINDVKSLHLKTYENINKKNIPTPQRDSLLHSTADNSSILSNSKRRLAELLIHGSKHIGNKKFGTLMLTPPDSETNQQNIKNGNNKINKGLLNPQMSFQVSNTTSIKNDVLVQKNSNNNFGARTVTNTNPISVPHRGSNNATLLRPVFIEPNKRSVAYKSSDGEQSPHTISSPRTSLDNNSLPSSNNSQTIEYPSAAVAKKGYTHLSRTAQYSAAPSAVSKISALTPRNINKTYVHSASNTISQVPTSAVLINGTASRSMPTLENTVSAVRQTPVMELKHENKFRSTSTSSQEDAVNSGFSSTATDSPGSESKKTIAPSSLDENVCPYCNKSFDPEILIHHKTLHFRKTFFACIDCGKNFKTDMGLQNHRCQVE